VVALPVQVAASCRKVAARADAGLRSTPVDPGTVHVVIVLERGRAGVAAAAWTGDPLPNMIDRRVAVKEWSGL